MAKTTDDLRLLVSRTEYERRIGLLDGKMREIGDIITEYEELKNRAAQLVLGEGDTNLQELQNQVEKNIQAVRGQLKLVQESRAELQKQVDALEQLSSDVGTMFKDAGEAARSGFKAIKAVGDMVN